MKPVYQLEVDRECRKVLQRHWPRVRRHGDIVATESANLAGVDLVCGGFPCQDLSVAGRRAGLAGKRSGLWSEFHRILEDTRPRWCLIENVPGLFSSPLERSGRDFAVILRGLAGLGYCVAWRVLDAQYFGLAQRRQRVFIVGSFGDFACVQILFEPESLSGDHPTSKETGARIAEGSFSRALSHVGGGDDPGANKGAPLVFHDRMGKTDRAIIDETSPPLRSSSKVVMAYPDPAYAVSGVRSKFGSGWHNQDTFVVGPIAPNAGPKSHDAGNFHSNQSVDAGHVFPVDSSSVRRLTPTECERLQGFPDDWTKFGEDGKAISDSQRYRMLGNAVAVPVAAWIGRRILAIEASR